MGWVVDGQPFVTPTSVWRQGDRLYWHGSRASRMLRQTDGQVVCVTVTHLDGLVLARSGFNHSVNYRSVMALGTAHLVTDDAEADAALETFIEHVPGRLGGAPPDHAEGAPGDLGLVDRPVRGIGQGPCGRSHDDPGDETWPAWAGRIPVRPVASEPVPDGFVPRGTPAPGGAHPG